MRNLVRSKERAWVAVPLPVLEHIRNVQETLSLSDTAFYGALTLIFILGFYLGIRWIRSR